MPVSIHLIEPSGSVREEEHLARFPGSVIVCDCYVAGIERGEEVPGGYARGRIVNVDHHADTPRMRRRISSANLAIERVRACGVASADSAVVINHTDCDSILSGGIVAGRLEPDDEYGVAAIAADHTGEAHPIADLLQALDRERDVELSFRSLDALRHGRPLEVRAQAALDDRRRKRQAAASAVASGLMQMDGPIAWGVFEETLQGEFFPALLPEAVVILAMAPHRDLPDGRLEMKLRLGAKAPEWLTLHGLVADFDPGFGGRWNAGANKRPKDGRPGGSEVAPEKYAAEVRRRVEARLASGGPGPSSI
jgi:hypothetical protein